MNLTTNIGMLVTAIEIDNDGFYNNENTDVQIIVAENKDTITTISMKNNTGEITYKSNETEIDGVKYKLIFDQNNNQELTIKAIDSKPELLTYPSIQAMLTEKYSELTKNDQLSPNELKIFNLIHQTQVKRFSLKQKTKKTKDSSIKTKNDALKSITESKKMFQMIGFTNRFE